ncbi:RpiR family transcriptional regulator [Burkholderia sp. OKR4-1]|uniref:RpiR family transcriptional regulator n=1 Tax=Burkholderia TaxID=32008 RepID=UPI0024C1A661|nr:RpiR family transcriptional regulator [Burkholderia contaminans]MDK0996824.1 RpiR family transcriptional regulator [Burkholderia contaminans]
MELRPNESPHNLASEAFLKLFQEADGWGIATVDEEADKAADFILTDDQGHRYVGVVKAFNNGRADYVTGAFAQAVLEARKHARDHHVRPAVLIWAGSLSPSLIDRLSAFHDEYGNGEPFAVLSGDGRRFVKFPGFEIDEDEATPSLRSRRIRSTQQPRLVFSDLNQWMLKCLLAVDIHHSERLISTMPTLIKSATELAQVALVSVMTATRLVNALREEGFLETVPFHNAPYLKVVQRRKLAKRWKAEYQRSPSAVAMKFLRPGGGDAQVQKWARKHGGAMGLFAAADLLGFGHVHGVPPAVWVSSLDEAVHSKELRRAKEGERPDLILQQPSFPQSLARGSITRDNVRVTDIIQTWLDVSSHPSRGVEQAEELEHGILASVVGESN